MTLNLRELHITHKKNYATLKKKIAKGCSGNTTSRSCQGYNQLVTHCQHTVVQVCLLQRLTLFGLARL